MAIKRNGLPEVWPSGLAKFLSGDLTCGYQLHFKAHHRKYTKVPSTYDFARWRQQHTVLLEATRARYEADGWKVRIEDQNYFRLKGQTAILAGKPDVIAQRKGETRVVDAKSGEPRDDHATQVGIYLVALPLAWKSPGLFITGEVVYPDHEVPVGAEVAGELQPKLFALLRRIGAANAMAAVPSERQCRFCDITKADCPTRLDQNEEPIPTASTEMF